MNVSNREALVGMLFDKATAAFDDRILAGKSVLVTGAGGSIGGALARRVGRSHAERIIITDISEAGLYQTQKAIGLHDTRVVPLMNDIRDPKTTNRLFDNEEVDLVVHAAALKHVPMLEIPHNALQAARTNILGTDNVCRAAARNGVTRVVSISTDKAVNPSSVLGLTKRLAELVVRLNAKTYATVEYTSVRFGNVINSAGSAVPLFKEQIAKGGPVTITDRNMTRYMMTMSDAVSLVLASAYLPNENGSLYVLEMGNPIRIEDLAHLLIRLADMEPGVDIDIKEIGIRPGEKLEEELFSTKEQHGSTEVDGIYRASEKPLTHQQASWIARLLLQLEKDTDEEMSQLMLRLVPEYTGDWKS